MPTISANGTDIAYAQQGHGPPIVLMHGAEADHSMFDAFAPLLASRFTVIAYDQRDSGATRNPPQDYSLAELADDAAALITALGHGRAHVFGTSLGGAIAQVLAVRHPGCIDRLILSSTFRVGANLLELNPTVMQKLAALRTALPGSAGEIAEYLFTPDYLRTHPEAAQIFARNTRDAAQKARRAAIMGRPLSVDLARITAPTLVLAGREDRLIPSEHTLSLAREIAHARAAAIAGIGHVGTIQNPVAVAREVLDFLA